MPGFAFDFEVGKGLARQLDEVYRAAAKLDDRVRRTDLETDARFAGSLLAALAEAERGLRRAPNVPAFAAAAQTYADKLERAEAAVSSVQARAVGQAPASAQS